MFTTPYASVSTSRRTRRSAARSSFGIEVSSWRGTSPVSAGSASSSASIASRRSASFLDHRPNLSPMAQPEKVTFYSSEPNQHLRLVDAMTGETRTLKFENGKLETSDPGLVPKLERLADT